ncbi:trypsin delta-like [Drosophila bipectinata]|uniref:trypsin delta-like n=1 Tax=Drosophila bipectinata TaxID=42026 RepID=UPI001C8A105D|nr:trypsin delta-like [Drosophila bipectinata]
MFLGLVILLSVVGILPILAGPQPENRIIGGSNTPISKVPWQVFLTTSLSSCGGSIYKKNFIITAAHCVYNEKAEDIKVYAGSETKNGALFEVQHISIHNEYYGSNQIDADIAILQLKKSLKFTNNIKAIPLADQEPAIGSVALASGWGATSIKETFDEIKRQAVKYNSPIQLQSVNVTIMERKRCDVFENNISKPVICAGSSEKGVCAGDSGGPLVVGGKLVGLTSTGVLFCNTPAFYTSIPYHKNWIMENTKSKE